MEQQQIARGGRLGRQPGEEATAHRRKLHEQLSQRMSRRIRRLVVTSTSTASSAHHETARRARRRRWRRDGIMQLEHAARELGGAKHLTPACARRGRPHARSVEARTALLVSSLVGARGSTATTAHRCADALKVPRQRRREQRCGGGEERQDGGVPLAWALQRRCACPQHGA